MNNKSIKNKILAGALCAVMTLGTNIAVMAQDVQPVAATQTSIESTMATATALTIYGKAFYEGSGSYIIFGEGFTGSVIYVYDSKWNPISFTVSQRDDNNVDLKNVWNGSGGYVIFKDASGNTLGGCQL